MNKFFLILKEWWTETDCFLKGTLTMLIQIRISEIKLVPFWGCLYIPYEIAVRFANNNTSVLGENDKNKTIIIFHLFVCCCTIIHVCRIGINRCHIVAIARTEYSFASKSSLCYKTTKHFSSMFLKRMVDPISFLYYSRTLFGPLYYIY